ncbi:hypothetical protein BH23CHL2_BH23CHL2_18930 [soil metagenome]
MRSFAEQFPHSGTGDLMADQIREERATGFLSRRRNQVIVGCGALLVACVGLVVIGAIIGALNGGDDDEATATEQVAGQPTNTESDSEQDEEPTPEPTDTTEPGEPTNTTAPTNTSEPTSPPEPTDTPEPTNTPEPPATSTPEPIEPGRGRSNPLPFGEAGRTPDGNWEVQILEVVRGQAAYDMLLVANQFNDPPEPGFEYVLFNIRAVNTSESAEPQEISYFDFDLTGDARVRWGTTFVVRPEPELDAELFSGGEATGWIAQTARVDEQNLILIYEPAVSFDEGDEIFMAAHDGANVPVLTERLAERNDLGTSRDNPAPLGDHVVDDTWEIWLNEVYRGEEALRRVKEANSFNDDPQVGFEYILINVSMRNVSPDAGSDNVSEISMFGSTGANNVIYDVPSIVDPSPEMRWDVYAGGEVSGWITVQAAQGEPGVVLVFEPEFFGGTTRYLALE